MSPRLARLTDHQFVRYFATSVGALAVDTGSFMLLLQTSLPAGVSAAISYTIGIVANWFLLSRFVFQTGTHDAGRARTVQKTMFLFSTWGGLAVTTGIVSAADFFGLHLWLSKAIAVGISFVLNYTVRKIFIFTADQATA